MAIDKGKSLQGTKDTLTARMRPAEASVHVSKPTQTNLKEVMMKTLNVNRPSGQTDSVTHYTEHIGYYLKFSLQILLVLLLSMTLMSVAMANDDDDGNGLTATLLQDPLFADFPTFFNIMGAQIASNDDQLMLGEFELFDETFFPIQRGAVYIYNRDGGGGVEVPHHQKISGGAPLDVENFDGNRFGSGGIEVIGDTMFVVAANNTDGLVDEFGADPLKDINRIPEPPLKLYDYKFAGQVLVYNRDPDDNQWKLVQRLNSGSPNAGGSFGGRSHGSHMALYSFGHSDKARVALIAEINNVGLTFDHDDDDMTPEVPDIERQKAEYPGLLHVFVRNPFCKLERILNGSNCKQWFRTQSIKSPRFAEETIMRFGNSVEGTASNERDWLKLALVSDSDSLNDGMDRRGLVHVYLVTPFGVLEHPLQSIGPPAGDSSNNIDDGLNFLYDLIGQYGIDGSGLVMSGSDAGTAVLAYGGYSQPLPADYTLSLDLPTEGFGEFFGAVIPAGTVYEAGTDVPVGAVSIYNVNVYDFHNPLTLSTTIVNPEPFDHTFRDLGWAGTGVHGVLYGSSVNLTGGPGKQIVDVSADGCMVAIGSPASAQPTDVYVCSSNGEFKLEDRLAISVPNEPAPGLDLDLSDFCPDGELCTGQFGAFDPFTFPGPWGVMNLLGYAVHFMGDNEIAISQGATGIPSARFEDDPTAFPSTVYIYGLDGDDDDDDDN